MNLPDYHFLSAPLWLITTLHWLTLTLHFLAMNFLVGGLVTLLVARIQNKWDDPTVRKLLKLFPTLMAATITLGVAPLLFLQLTYHQQVYSAAIVSAWFWLSILAVAMASYYFLYGAAFAKVGSTRVGTYLTLALLGLIYVSFMYSGAFSLAEKPGLIKELYQQDQSGLTVNNHFGDYLVRWLHMLFGAFTVGGFFAGLMGQHQERLFRTGRGVFLYGMMGAITFGLFNLLTLGDLLMPFMRSAGIWLVTIGLVLSAAALHFYFKKKFLISGVLVFVSLFMMVVTRHLLRSMRLEGIWDSASIPIHPQWSVLVLFVACFVLALVLIGYMLKLFFSGGHERPA
jgi:hypothetical protein